MTYSTWRENFNFFTVRILTAAIIFTSIGSVIRAQKSDDSINAPASEITAACSENSFVFEGNEGDGPDGSIGTFNAEPRGVKAIKVCTFKNAQLTPSGANAAVAGRAVTVDGVGISRAVLTLTNVQSGEAITTVTNHFGYFNLEAHVGPFYTLTISQKRYVFPDGVRTFSLLDDLTDIEFVGSL